MQSPSHLIPDYPQPGSPLNYESLYLKEKDKNAILLARLNEKEALIHQLHRANDEAYSEINHLEEKARALQAENDEKIRILLQREGEISALRRQLSKAQEGVYFRDNGSMTLESPAGKEPVLGTKNSFDLEHKRQKYMTLGNDRRDLDMLFGSLKENDVEKLKHDLRIYEKFHETLGKAVIDCSPPELYKLKPPSLKQIWKWIRNLLEEYMALKKKGNE